MATLNAKRTIEGTPPPPPPPFNASISLLTTIASTASMPLSMPGKACEGYWDGDKMLEQIDVFNFLHPEEHALFICDWSKSIHQMPGMPKKNGGESGAKCVSLKRITHIQI